MRARIGAGVAGWLAGLAPLVAVNVASYIGLLSYDELVPAGALGLFGGIALGGILSGALGARRGGAMAGAAVGGGIAAVLYAATIFALLFGTGHRASAPQLIAAHPIRASVAILFCGALLLTVALAAGTIVGRGSMRAPESVPGQRAPGAPRLGVPTRALNGQPQPPARVPSTPVASRQRLWGQQDASGPYGAEDASVYAPGRRGGAEGMSRPVAPRRGGLDGQGRYDQRRG
jgi:hypothetical protein